MGSTVAVIDLDVAPATGGDARPRFRFGVLAAAALLFVLGGAASVMVPRLEMTVLSVGRAMS